MEHAGPNIVDLSMISENLILAVGEKKMLQADGSRIVKICLIETVDCKFYKNMIVW